VIARVSVGALAARTVSLTVPLYIASLLLAVGPAAVGMIGLASIAADRPWRADLLGPNWLNLLLELLGALVYAGASPGVVVMGLAGLLLVPAAAFGQMLAYSFLAGGILERLSPGIDQDDSFWAACRRWFWPSLRLSLLGGVIVMAAGLGVGLLTGLAGRWIGASASAGVQLIVQALVLGWLELARALMVRQSQRSVGRCLRLAAGAWLRPPVLGLWVALALPPAALLLAAINPLATSDPYSILDLVKALVYGQAVAFLSAWTKVIRLAVAMQLAVVVRPAAPAAVAPVRVRS
jgi:hypothetical protein